MPLFKLKAGGHVSGSIADKDGNNTVQEYSAKGPNNIVESDQNLAAVYPEKFEAYDGPAPQKQQFGPRGLITGEPLPPGPPTDRDYAEANLMKSMTPEDRRKQAEWHRQQAESLDMEAGESERNIEIGKQQQASRTPASAEEADDTSSTKSSKSTKSGIPTDSELNQKTKDELLELAQQEELDVKSHDTRADIIKALRAARKA